MLLKSILPKDKLKQQKFWQKREIKQPREDRG
jgi:hypothetical protein